jgi:ABC-type phosphate/phosphonate transport system permease subunit
MDMAPVDALRVAGAGRLQVFFHAVLLGVRNTLLALTMYASTRTSARPSRLGRSVAAASAS